MILFKKISWKNFLSTGNQNTEIDFLKNKTNLIIGSNGSGKSTILDALTFSLFGKAFRKINKSQLINNVNEKDCVVSIYFSIGNIDWKIIRGIKPNIFKIYKNDKLLDQLNSSNDQQKWLEQNILKMNYKSFTQIVILGSSDFVPFMQLSTPQRREVIEDLLDIKVFSQMNFICKENIKLLRSDFTTLDLKKKSFEDKIKMQENFILDIKNRDEKKISEKKNIIKLSSLEINELIESNNKLIDTNNKFENNTKKYLNTDGRIQKLLDLRGKISQKKENSYSTYDFFVNNSVCPTCTQNIDEEFRINKVGELKSILKELNEGYDELKNLIEIEKKNQEIFFKLKEKISKNLNEISKNNTKISLLQKQIQNYEQEIQTSADRLQDENIEYVKLKEFNNNLNKINSDLLNNKEKIKYYEYIHNLLKDNGIKVKIIEKYLPLINKEVNKYLQMMDFYINFSFDAEFNESIHSPIHEDFTYSSFSEGEKTRINLALIFAWREVAKFKNSVNTNLLIMDEVFDSSLDGFGTDDFLKIIKYSIKNNNIFVISHKENLYDQFERVIKFEKYKGFSNIKVNI